MKILPSLLAAPPLRMHQAIKQMLDLGLSHFHIDMMDYKFTHNFGLNTALCAQILQEFPNVTLDVHLMTDPTPLHLIEQLHDLGITDISLHAHTLTPQDHLSLAKMSKLNIRIAITPNDTFDDSLLAYERLLILTVNPGFCNQPLQEHTLEYAKIAKDRGIDIMIDGGINLQTASKIQQIAPHSVVIGGGLFGKTIEQQQQLIAKLTMDPQG